MNENELSRLGLPYPPVTIFVMDAKGVVARVGKFLAVEDCFLYFLNERNEEEAINTRDIIRFVKAIVPKRGD